MKIENDLISIVIPVYNTSEYLKRCLDSVCNQDYHHLEIILVDDGSTDNSSEVCQEYKKKDDRIQIISQRNQGPAAARNNGIREARGSFLAFIDSDDYVAKNFISRMYELAIENKAQLVQCVIQIVDDHNKGEQNSEDWCKAMSGLEFLRSYYNKCYSGFANPVNKLYACELLKDLTFPDGRIHEDAALTYKIYYKAERVVYTSQKLYFYYMSDNSIMRKPFYLKRLDWLDALEEKLDFLQNIGEDSLRRRALQEYQAVLLKLYYNVKRYYPQADDGRVLQKIKTKLMANYKPTIQASEVLFSAKILFVVGSVFPYFTGKLINRMI